MNILYSPWRENYTRNTKSKNFSNTSICIFCTHANDTINDINNFILARKNYSFTILNLYPYNAGHILIIPYEHKSELFELNKQTQHEIIESITEASSILKNTLACDGINIGLNIGSSAGAGIPDHLHVHVLPRWDGDTNFLPLLSQTKQISFDIVKIYNQLKPAFMKKNISANQA